MKKETNQATHGYWWLVKQANTLSRIILTSISNISNHLAIGTTKVILNFLQKLAFLTSRLINIISINKLQLYQYEGIEKFSNKKINILLSLDDESKNFFKNLIGDKFKLQKEYGNLSLKKINKIIIKNSSHDIAIIKADLFYRKYLQRHGYHIIPEYISFSSYPSSTIENIMTTFNQEVIQELEKASAYQLTYDITSNYNDFKNFYQKMYLPYINWKHQSHAKIASFSSILFLYHQGAKILQIKENNEIIFSGIFIERKHSIKTYYAAFMQGKYDYLKKGVTALSYYYLIKYAYNKNKKSIDFGTARPFITDGMFKYKSKWGMNIELSPPGISQIFSIKFKTNSASVRSFLLNNSFISLENNELIGNFFIDQKENKSMQNEILTNNLKGLSDIRYTTTREFLNK